MDSSADDESPGKVQSVEKKAKKSKKHKKHKKSSKSASGTEKVKKSKSSKKKRRHSDETHSEAEDGHRSHKSKKAKEQSDKKADPETSANVVVRESSNKRPSDAEVSQVLAKRDRKSSSDNTVTNKSNGQTKLLTNPPKSSKPGGIPTDPSKLVEILTKSLDPNASPDAATEVLSSDSENDHR